MQRELGAFAYAAAEDANASNDQQPIGLGFGRAIGQYFGWNFQSMFIFRSSQLAKQTALFDRNVMIVVCINITEGDWRIHSTDMYLTKKSQLELLDTLRINQFHVPAGKDTWRVKNQLLHFNFKSF